MIGEIAIRRIDTGRLLRKFFLGAGLLSLFLILLAFAFYLKTPYLGIEARFMGDELVVTSLGPGGLASAENIKIGARIIEVDGRPAKYLRDLRVVRPRKSVLIRTEEGIRLISTEGKPLPLSAVIFTILSFITSFNFLLMGLIVFKRRPYYKGTLPFYIFTIALGLFLTSLAGAARGFPGTIVSQVVLLILMGASFSRFAIEIGGMEEKLAYIHIPLLPFLIAFAVFGYRNDLLFPYFRYATLALFFAYLLFSFVILLRSSFYASDFRARYQSRIITSGIGVTTFPFLFLNFIPELLFHRPILSTQYLFPFLLLSPLSVIYAILRYGFFDIDRIGRRILASITPSLIFLPLYFFAVYAIVRTSLSLPAKVTLLILLISGGVFLFNHFRTGLERLLSGELFKKRADYRNLAKFVISSVYSCENARTMGSFIVETLMKNLDLSGAVFILKENGAEVLSKSGDIGFEDGELLSLVENIKGEYLFPESAERLDPRLSYIIPLELKEGRKGVLVLGSKRRGEDFSYDEYLLIGTLSDELRVALDNLILSEDVKRKEKKLEEQAFHLK